MDELEVTIAEKAHDRRTDCNHIFLNFLPSVIMDPAKLEESVTEVIERYGQRLLKLRVLQAEVKMVIRQTTQSPTQTLRLCISNDSGYCLNIVTYKEITDRDSGIVIEKFFVSS